MQTLQNDQQYLRDILSAVFDAMAINKEQTQLFFNVANETLKQRTEQDCTKAVLKIIEVLKIRAKDLESAIVKQKEQDKAREKEKSVFDD